MDRLGMEIQKSGDQESGMGVIGVGMGVTFLSALVSLLNL